MIVPESAVLAAARAEFAAAALGPWEELSVRTQQWYHEGARRQLEAAYPYLRDAILREEGA